MQWSLSSLNRAAAPARTGMWPSQSPMWGPEKKNAEFSKFMALPVELYSLRLALSAATMGTALPAIELLSLLLPLLSSPPFLLCLLLFPILSPPLLSRPAWWEIHSLPQIIAFSCILALLSLPLLSHFTYKTELHTAYTEQPKWILLSCICCAVMFLYIQHFHTSVL